MAIESLTGVNGGAMESTSISPHFSEFNPQTKEGNLSPKFSEEKIESKLSENIPNCNQEGYCNNLQADENGRIKTRNEGLEGQNHSETGVPFKEKTVETDTGEKVTGVFPEFDSKFDAQLPEDMQKESDSKQFDECNKQLKEAVESDPELAKQFDEEQLEQIKNGDTPDGYTWHHNEEKGKMQLVDSETHAKTGHTGGRSIWGGGTENR